ncbi:MAG TPA: M48 family metalloprotease [Pyrinomonadaceae bacterium]|nr:M48 family metalloprotease [Pyrinomonadaceae bacterium]
MKQFRNLSATVVLDGTPSSIQRATSGKWTGTILADARRINITEQSDVRFKLNKAEEKADKEEKKKAEKEAKDKKDDPKPTGQAGEEPVTADTDETGPSPDRDDFEDEDDLSDLMKDSRPLRGLDQIGPGVYMTYHGKEDSSGSVSAETIVFVRNEKTKQEKDLWKKAKIKEKDAKDANSFAKMKVGSKEYKVLPEEEVQEYVNRLGQSLVPEYQKHLLDEDDNKIPFRFAVVYEKSLNASCYPTGTMVINHELFNQLENEAQLVFILSHEIAHATQEHIVREMNHNRKRRKGLFIASIVTAGMGYNNISSLLKYSLVVMQMGYARTTENQADRMGLSNMIYHGYDPREAPRTWKLFSLLGEDGPQTFLSDHDSNTERRSFLWMTIHNTYPTLDFAAMKRDSDDFHRISEIVRQKYPSKLKKGKAA